MVTKDSIKKWVRRHRGKHYCRCGCGERIEVKASHHKKGVPKFIKGHNFASNFNPKVDENPDLVVKSASWEVLSDEEKERRLSNLKKFKSMENHPGWKGGRVVDENGYIRLRMPNHLFSRDGYILEHRFVMEEFLREEYPGSPYLHFYRGKLYLKPEAVVHHINEIKDDNRLENLFPFPDNAAHAFWHKSPLSEKEKIDRIKKGLYKTYIDLEKIETNDD